MHGEPSSLLDDAALLEEWVLNRREEAFAELVAHYQKLVFAAALRRTGNPESARDVAQQVFATLAAKAPLLIGRRNIAGWLYHAASHLGARALRTERRRAEAQNHAEFSGNCSGQAEQGLWGAVEDAVGALGEGDREAIVLHYLEDRSYPEMAAALGITEAAARKRVSRALQLLEERLRVRGVGRSATAVIAAVVAQQSAAPLSASGGLAAGAIASSATVSTPLNILMSTVLTHTTTKLAAGMAAVFLVPLALQWNANASLRQEIASTRSKAPPPPPAVVFTDSQRLATLRAELAAKREAVVAAENKVAELAALKRKLETEVVYSMGTVESMARELANASRVATSLEERQDALMKARAKDPNSEESKRLGNELTKTAADAATLMPRALALARELLKMERSPEKAAHFYAAFLAEAGGLDEATRAKVEERIQPWIIELQRDGLALPQRPKTIDRVQWDERRAAATQSMIKSLAGEFPNVQWEQLPLDQHLGAGKDTDWFDMFLSEDDQP